MAQTTVQLPSRLGPLGAKRVVVEAVNAVYKYKTVSKVYKK
jgi:hypothetical protein